MMDGFRDPNCLKRQARSRPMSPQQQRLAIERAQRMMETPLECASNEQFAAWSRDATLENELLGPMPAGAAPEGEPRAPCCQPPFPAGGCETPLLTREQEIHLFRKMNYLKYKAGVLRERLNPRRPQTTLLAQLEKLCEEIVATRNQIVCANLRLVISIAKRYVRPGQNIFELVSDGNISLMHAVDRFDYALGNRFSTYASWAIINTFVRVGTAGMRYRQRFHTDHSDTFTATADDRSNQYEVEAIQARRKAAIESILRRLGNREREIVVGRFGLRHGQEPQTLQEIGNVMGVSKERIRQIEIRALGKLRKAFAGGDTAGRR